MDVSFLKEAQKDFTKVIGNCENQILAEVYSIVDNIVKVDIFDVKSHLFRVNIVDRLIKLGLCQKCEEDLLSRNKHEERMNRLTSSLSRNQQRSNNQWISVKDLGKIISQAEFSENTIDLPNAGSPLSVTCLPMLKRGTSNVRISHNSINFVLLDDSPEIPGSSLIIAHKIDTDEKKSDLVLYNTSLFPKKAGLVSLCTMLFAPTVELRADKKNKNYSGALCGLGYDRQLKRALFVENDIELVFDVKFDSIDIDDVNFYLFFFFKLFFFNMLN